jgi:radical SAM protein with 4Fe4S-binding SPASM domain
VIEKNDLIIVPEKHHHYSRDGWNLLYDPVNVRWVRLNDDGIKIINAIEKYKYIDVITANLAKEDPDQPVEDIRGVVGGFIESLVDSGFLHLNQYKKQEFKFPIRTIPYEIYFFMTYRCNLKCKYCYDIADRTTLLKESNENKTPTLTFEEYKKLVQAAKHIGIKTCILTGGEPLLNPMTIELGRYILEQGLDTELITNGTLVNEANAGAIAETFKTISISLDSLNKQTHEKMRGKGIFKKIVESIKILKAHNAYIRVNSVITKANVKEILATRIWAYDCLGCDTYTPSLYNPSSKDPEIYGRFMPEMEDLLNEQQRIRDHFKDKPGVAFNPAMIRCNCGIGTNNISISPYGNVFPCHALHKPELKCGNVREQRLEQILEESKRLHELRHFSVDDVEFCRECDFKYLCSGGCAAINYNVFGDFYVKDNFYCDYIKQEQIERMWTYTTHNIKNREPISSKN